VGTALRAFAHPTVRFGTSAQFWLNLQSAFDIRVAQKAVGAEIARLPKRRATSSS